LGDLIDKIITQPCNFWVNKRMFTNVRDRTTAYCIGPNLMP